MKTNQRKRQKQGTSRIAREETTFSKIWRFLGSPKLTLVIAVFVLGSIVYYKGTLKKAKPKNKQAKQTQHTPLFVPQNVLGRSRPRGPLLTTDFFSTGDLILRKQKKTLQLAWIYKEKNKKPQVISLEGSRSPLLTWLKATGGRFALYRMAKAHRSQAHKALSAWRNKATSRATSQPTSRTHPLGRLAQTYQSAKLPFPASKTPQNPQAWLQSIASRGHYNDFRPPPKPNNSP